jgi:hypothetical protein
LDKERTRRPVEICLQGGVACEDWRIEDAKEDKEANGCKQVLEPPRYVRGGEARALHVRYLM